ncbi:MAG: hypothetical protein A2Y73_03360 [Chloroflexi bacterium RBG_13_56_8]|nr:MAG: hypothetical protein A2Y73_03360 [Chloroflexi bacterium RBG_13_56_8]
MYAVLFSTSLEAILVLLALVLLGGLLFIARQALVSRTKLRLRGQELTAARKEIAQQSAYLDTAKREIARLQRIPKSELLPMLQLAHELRSPLASIQNALDMLMQGYATTSIELQNEMLGLARDRVEELLAWVNDFLSLGVAKHAKIERTVKPVQLLEVLQRLAPEIRLRARWRAVNVQMHLPDSLPQINGTDQDMEHLLSNLISNAIKYTNPGGQVTISLEAKENGVIGTVSDTGIGILPEDLPIIFEDFYRSQTAKEMDAHGTGLGLSIAKRVVDSYGGQLKVESEVGKGSTFTFIFPQIDSLEGALG